MRASFEEWKRQVNIELARLCGMVADDLPDCDYWMEWQSGTSPLEMAHEALEAAGFGDHVE